MNNIVSIIYKGIKYLNTNIIYYQFWKKFILFKNQKLINLDIQLLKLK